MAEEKPENKDEAPEEPKKDIPLFRQEALKHKKGSFLGKAIIITPISFSIWTVGLFSIAIAVVLYLYFGTYAKRQEVGGVLVPNKGLINVFASKPGIVVERFVKQGEKVTKNQLLFLVSTEQHTLAEEGAVAQQVKLLEKRVELTKNQLEIFKKNLERAKKLLDERAFSEAEYQDVYNKYLGIQSELHRLEQDLINVKGAGDFAVRAPASGTISTLVAMAGDQVVTHKTIASIIPKGAVLEGMLLVQTKAIGFVKTGQKVLLKYEAFPFQSFGLYEATVDRIDKSILFGKDLDIPMPPEAQTVGFYRVFVTLKQSFVTVYGKPYPLKPGMSFKAVLLGDKRNIWQWILEPIYSLRGSLTSP